MHQLPTDPRAEVQTLRRTPRRAIHRPWLISGAVLFLDQLTKAFVQAAWVLGERHPFLPPVVSFTYVQNTGAAFGLFKGQQWLFVPVSVVVIGWLLREWRLAPVREPVTRWAEALILGGTVGNLMDRLRFGYVVDFLDLRVWPVFNVGDSAITIGVALLIWRALRK